MKKKIDTGKFGNIMKIDNNISRRDFLKLAGIVAVSTAGISTCEIFGDEKSEGYILVDTKKCQGCQSCMIACSLVHEGSVCPSLSRIQVMQDPTLGWPDDISVEQCRHCIDPKCVHACTTGALQVDPDNLNARVVRYRIACSGCGECARACPYQPKKPVISNDIKYGGLPKARKCDLCLNTPYHFFWENYTGDINDIKGKQACVLACPMNAIIFTSDVPEQTDEGYKVDLRGGSWGKLGFPES